MADRVVLVNGLPASGKTTLATALAEQLAHERLERRRPERHPVHGSWRPGFWNGAVPITDEPLLVDTTIDVDVAALADRVARAMAA